MNRSLGLRDYIHDIVNILRVLVKFVLSTNDQNSERHIVIEVDLFKNI